MKRFAKLLACGGLAMSLGLLPIAFGQNTQPQPTLDSRVRQLELSLGMLNNQLQMRTEVSGPQDRTTRDYNLDTRIDDLERQIQQLNNTLMDLQRQIGDAVRAASQAQNDAMMAQQIARDAQSRIN